MSFEQKLNKLYQQIAQYIVDMIPVDWCEFYFNGEVMGKEGGVFFFFTPKAELEKAVFSHFIPKVYGVDKRLYNRELHELFKLTHELQKVFIDNNQKPWFSVTMIVNESGKLSVMFDYTNWTNSDFGPSARIKYFEYKYISQDKNGHDLELIERMKEYEKANN
ncbi:immunity protein YezG family protein [Bacillus sp. USDA818B3_A]|uniref:immunity protein YezG family protein n=1 Tax=Bacillus sp. USDA818B3_A TaxID=2698834 RepID=UPI00136C1A93|nr:immunity protein YezG family protein [Bacillus sp. USDA818B3_A]